MTVALWACAASAGADERPLSPGAQAFLTGIQKQAEFATCVAERIPDDDALVDRVVAQGLASDLHAAVFDHVDADDAVLAGFSTTSTDPQRVLAEKAMYAMARAMAGVRENDEAGVDRMGLLDAFNDIANRALGSPCDDSARRAARAGFERLQPVMAEAKRVQDCADAAMAREGTGLDAALARLDADPDAPRMRADLMRLIDATNPPADERARLAGRPVGQLVTALQFLSASTFDLELLTRAQAASAFYADRASGASCHPSEELTDYLGATARAD